MQLKLTPEEVERARRLDSAAAARREAARQQEDAKSICIRCKRPTEYGAKWCYSCEIAVWEAD